MFDVCRSLLQRYGHDTEDNLLNTYICAMSAKTMLGYKEAIIVDGKAVNLIRVIVGTTFKFHVSLRLDKLHFPLFSMWSMCSI